ncbi:MAG: LuxR family transcriptional regulator [Aeromicrobium sp.]
MTERSRERPAEVLAHPATWAAGPEVARDPASAGSSPTRHLVGREDELARIAALMGLARNGRGAALLCTGDPGIGKTSLLAAATAGLHAVTLIRLRGYEAENTLPFAAIERLVRPLSDHLGSLPERHRDALEVASGTASGHPPDRFLVGLGVLGLLAAAGEDVPVVCVVDDAHLLDDESMDVLAFVGRRLEAESVLLLMAGRESPTLMARAAGVPTHRLSGLPTDAAVRLLVDSVTEPIDPAVAMKIVTATGGNPLALVDLAAELTVRQLTESSFADEPLPIGRHLEQYYLRQVRRLSDVEQTWLLVAAAVSAGDLDLIAATAHRLELPADAAEAAEAAGLVELGRTVRFRHPLVRSAAYNAAHGRERRRVHRAVAGVAQELGQADRAAWHAAKATLGTSEDAARRLEQVADAAAARGGFASRARVLVEAAALTPTGGPKYARLVSAAEAALAAGSGQLAKNLLDEIDEDVLDPVSRGRYITAGADYSLFVAAPTLTRAAADMLGAAELFHGQDDDLEQRSLLKAWEWALPAERLATGFEWKELGVRLLEGADVKEGDAATILRGIAALILKPYTEAAPLVRQALDVYDGMTADDLLVYGHSCVALATYLWDLDARHRILERWAAAARDAGSLTTLDTALWLLSVTEAIGGTPRRAAQYMEQVRELRRAIGYDAEHVVNLAVLAWSAAGRGRVAEMADRTVEMGFGGVHASAMSALATVDIAEGRYRDAYDKLKPFIDDPFLHVTATMWPDFAEAAARSGHPEDAADAVRAMEEVAEVAGTSWAAGAALRGRAMLGSDVRPGAPPDATVEVERGFQAAIAELERTRAMVELGRAHLLLGEWLRRSKRRRDARPHLRAAVELFDRAGADPFVDRASRELEATGEPPRSGGVARTADLTQQELTVAELAASGKTNAEIAATMFLSVNTIDYHLRKVFQKLGISSRRQLFDRVGGS